MRIAGRDLLGIADLRTVGAELSGGRAGVPRPRRSQSPRPTVPMAVIGMGKLGGAELNYASDVDIMFVHDGDSAEAERGGAGVAAQR